MLRQPTHGGLSGRSSPALSGKSGGLVLATRLLAGGGRWDYSLPEGGPFLPTMPSSPDNSDSGERGAGPAFCRRYPGVFCPCWFCRGGDPASTEGDRVTRPPLSDAEVF
jgi:hypothetical protein